MNAVVRTYQVLIERVAHAPEAQDALQAVSETLHVYVWGGAVGAGEGVFPVSAAGSVVIVYE